MKRFLLIIYVVAFCNTFNTSGQIFLPKNQNGLDDRLYHFGFSLGLHSQSLSITPTEPYTNSTALNPVENSLIPGFNVGLVAEAKLSKYVSIRTTPTIFFGEKKISFSDNYSAQCKSNYIYVPLGFKFSAERFNNSRPYIYVGAAAAFDLAQRQDNPILLKPFNGFIELAIGWDCYLEYFKLIPEIKVCFGLNNVFESNREGHNIGDLIRYSQSIQKIVPGMVVLSFYFE